jgi:hypothetical protein
MNDNDSPKWPNMDRLNSFRRPDPNDAPNTPGSASPDGYASQPTFEDRLTFDDKLFLHSVGTSL